MSSIKIFAYDILKPNVTMEQIQPLLKEEAKHAWELYNSGFFRELYLRTDRPGALNVIESENVEEAKRIMNELPLVKAGLIEFNYIPVGPFTPFENLFSDE